MGGYREADKMTLEEAYIAGWQQGFERGATDKPKPIGPIDFDDSGEMHAALSASAERKP